MVGAGKEAKIVVCAVLHFIPSYQSFPVFQVLLHTEGANSTGDQVLPGTNHLHQQRHGQHLYPIYFHEDKYLLKRANFCCFNFRSLHVYTRHILTHLIL